MSRPSKPKPAAANAPKPETPAAAPAAATPDPVNTPQVAPEPTGAAVAAAAPVDPHMPTGPGASADPAKDPNGNPPSTQTPSAKGFVLRVTGPAKGRWRAGRHFGPEAVDIPAADLTEDEIARLNGDPQLMVLVIGEA